MTDVLERGARDAALAAAPPSPKREAIVQAAMGLFLEAGYGAVSMDAIAAEAGVSKRTLYCHFSGKDVLFGAVMSNVCASVVGRPAPVEVADRPPREALSDFGRTFLRLIASRHALAIFRVATAESDRFPELGEVFYRTGPQRWIGALAEYLAKQDRRDVLRVPDPQAAAGQFLALVKGPIHMRLCLGAGPRPSEAELDAVVAAAVAVFVRGYAP